MTSFIVLMCVTILLYIFLKNTINHVQILSLRVGKTLDFTRAVSPTFTEGFNPHYLHKVTYDTTCLHFML